MTSISELEQDIAESRARLDRTIDQLQDRMTASGVVDEVLGTARRSGYGGTLDRAADTLRAHPVPVLLVVAGLGWLAYSMTEAGRRRDMRARARRDLDERLGPRPAVRPIDRDAPEAHEDERRERAAREAAAASARGPAATPARPQPSTVGASDLRPGGTRPGGTATRSYEGDKQTAAAASGNSGSGAATSRTGEPPDRGGVTAGARVGERVMGTGGLRATDVPPGAVRRPQDATHAPTHPPTHAASEGEALHRSPAPTPGRPSPAAPGDVVGMPPGTRR